MLDDLPRHGVLIAIALVVATALTQLSTMQTSEAAACTDAGAGATWLNACIDLAALTPIRTVPATVTIGGAPSMRPVPLSGERTLLGPGDGAFVLQSGPPGIARLTWGDNPQAIGYLLIRWSPTATRIYPADGSLLPRAPTEFLDAVMLADSAACYTLVAVGSSGQALQASEVLCVLPGTRSETGAPGSMTIDLETSSAMLNWVPPGNQSHYQLRPFPLNGGSRPAITVDGSATSTTDDTGGVPTCYVLVAFVATTILGSSDAVCAIPVPTPAPSPTTTRTPTISPTAPAPSATPSPSATSGPGGLVPAPRSQSSVVWDPARGELLMSGGADCRAGCQYFDDLWSYRPASGIWSRLAPIGPVPAARSLHSAVWDAVGGRMLVFGGAGCGPTGCPRRNDLWSYDRTSNRWSELAPIGTLPGPSVGHTAVWDAADQQMLVFDVNCGSLENCTEPRDVWAYRAVTNSWVRLPPAGSAVPPPRDSHGAGWDAERREMLIFGGYTCPAPFTCLRLNDLWSYRPDTSTWTELHPTGPLPPPRAATSAVWDPDGGDLVIHGGVTCQPHFPNCGYFGDLWAYNRTRNEWRELTPANGLRPRIGHDAAIDVATRRMYVFGGIECQPGLVNCVYLNDIVELDLMKL